MLYKEYVKVESDFIPVFSSSSDKTHPEKWKTFYPHDSFKKILTLTIEALEKNSSLKDRPIWISGSYGTGKTFASFVIKHILEDNLTDVEKYLSHHGLKSLWHRVAAVRRKGKILVVHQSSSAGINSQNKLFNTIIESVKHTLRENDYPYTGAASSLEKVLATLKDPNATFNFKSAFKKHREKFLEYSSPQAVIKDLETLEDIERLDLLEVITEVADKESYNWSMSVQDVVEWLRSIRRKNKIHAILFIWDEFTEYFRNNLNNITGLQELAQYSSEINFYFFLITHSNFSQLITDPVQRKIIEARFKMSHIVLAESTAFQLMAQALKVETDVQADWAKISIELWETVQRDAADFIIQRDDSIKPDDMKNLLPLHPYVAYLLKFITQEISSNQRTMFQFLCADGKGSFKEFIDSHGFEYGGDNFLTTDFLWDYFFQEDNPDLDRTLLEAMGHYNNFAPSCKNENQKRVLKATLILFVLQQKNIGGRNKASSLLRATQKNLCACFAGTPLENEILPTLNYFADRGIVSVLEETNDTYFILATSQIDSERMKKVVAQVQNEKPFDSIIKDEFYGVAKSFLPIDYMKPRLDIRIISPLKFLRTSVANIQLADNQILAFYIFVVDEEEQGKVNQAIKKIRENFATRCIIADFSGTPFTRQRYQKFLQNKARELYFKDLPNQASQVKLAKKSATDLVTEWIRQLAVATVRVWSSNTEFVQVSGEGNFMRALREINQKFYGDGLEEISINDKLFAPTGLTENLTKAALRGERLKGGASWLNLIVDPFCEISEREKKEYWLASPSNTISKMKIVVENFIAQSLTTRNEVCFSEIWDELKKPPIGLFKCPGAIFLFALLMKDYADKNYYVRDFNNNTAPLTIDKLCNLILNTIKESPGSRDKFILKQTPEHVKFCWIISEIFNLSHGKINSLDDAAKNIKIRLAQIRYPLWTLKYFVEEEYPDATTREIYLQLLNLLEEFITPRNVRDIPKIADEFFAIYDQNPSSLADLQIIMREENFKAGMTGYVAQYKPQLKKVIGRLKLPDNEYLSHLKEKLSLDSAYLWKIDDINRQIDNLFDELCLLEAINSVLPTPQKKLSVALRHLKEKFNKVRIPRSVIEEFQPDLKNFFQTVIALCDSSEKNFKQATVQINQSAKIFLEFFENQSSFFEQTLLKYVNPTIDLELIRKMFNDAPAGLFFQTRDNFVLLIKSRLKKFRQAEKINKLFAKWQEVTRTASPADWSKQNEIPILCIFQDCFEEAQSYFGALNKKFQFTTEGSLDAAIRFLHDEKIARLNDKTFCERLFVNYFCGEDYSFVVDVDNLRKVLRKSLGNEVYSWFAYKGNCAQQIQAVADQNYREKFLAAVHDKIHELSAEETQKYLEELIDKDTLLGIRILRNSRGGADD